MRAAVFERLERLRRRALLHPRRTLQLPTAGAACVDSGCVISFSAPLPALQTRTVAFAPFIAGMDLSQLEILVATPVEEVPLIAGQEQGGIHEYEFR